MKNVRKATMNYRMQIIKHTAPKLSVTPYKTVERKLDEATQKAREELSEFMSAKA